MRKLVYEFNEIDEITYTLKDKKTIESEGWKAETKLFDIPEKKNLPKVKPWITVNGKLVRQYA